MKPFIKITTLLVLGLGLTPVTQAAPRSDCSFTPGAYVGGFEIAAPAGGNQISKFYVTMNSDGIVTILNPAAGDEPTIGVWDCLDGSNANFDHIRLTTVGNSGATTDHIDKTNPGGGSKTQLKPDAWRIRVGVANIGATGGFLNSQTYFTFEDQNPFLLPLTVGDTTSIPLKFVFAPQDRPISRISQLPFIDPTNQNTVIADPSVSTP